MLAYFGSRISEHMTRTPEGFLICHSVPIARTGGQRYLKTEIGLTGDGLVTVTRIEDEVFSKQAIASFEGKPVTEEHPPCAVSPENYVMYSKGHCQNVHRGVGADSDLLIADLFINDRELIRKIDNGLREVSCGYECEYAEDEDGHYYQCKIRGNHVAVVEAGRAGNRVSIKDSAELLKERTGGKMKKQPSMLARCFSGWVQDKTPEEVAFAIDELIEGGEDENENGYVEVEEMKPMHDACKPIVAETVDPMKGAKNPVEDATVHFNNQEEILNMLQSIIDKLNEAPAVDAEPDPVDKLIAELENEEQGAPATEQPEEQADADASFAYQEEEEVVPEDEEIVDALIENPAVPQQMPQQMPVPQKQMNGDSAYMVAALKAIKPYLAKMPVGDRRDAADSAVKAIRNAKGMKAHATTDGYNVVAKSRNAVNSKPSKTVDDSELGRSIMEKFNPHYKKN